MSQSRSRCQVSLKAIAVTARAAASLPHRLGKLRQRVAGAAPCWLPKAIMLCCAALRCAALRCAVLRCAALCCAVLLRPSWMPGRPPAPPWLGPAPAAAARAPPAACGREGGQASHERSRPSRSSPVSADSAAPAGERRSGMQRRRLALCSGMLAGWVIQGRTQEPSPSPQHAQQARPSLDPANPAA